MAFVIIAAVAQNGVIGDSSKRGMPWYCKEELRFFKKMTMGTIVVMGRKTAEETGKLRERDCLVVSRDPGYKLKGFATVTLPKLMAMNAKNPNIQYSICGGAELYQLMLPHADAIIISYMPFEARGDVIMPEIDRSLFVETQSFEMKEFTSKLYVSKRYLHLPTLN